MEVFRAKMLPKFTLGITPITGYAPRKQSIVGNAWLDYLQHIDRQRIFREYRLGPFYADGFRPATKEVFEFWGCLYHGCITCFPDRTTLLDLNGERVSVKTLYDKVELKRQYYQHRGYTLVEIWEHEFD